MKKVLCFCLTAILLLTGAVNVTASAEEEYSAPVFYGVQMTKPAEDTQNIRFVSLVSDNHGSILGYVITATYTENGNTKSVTSTYSAAAGDEGMESSTVYTSLQQEGYDPKTAAEVGAELGIDHPFGLFALNITGVPTNIGEIVFTVSTYVKEGEEVKAASDPVRFLMINGEYIGKILYSEDFEGYDTDALWTDHYITYYSKNYNLLHVKQDENGNKYLALREVWPGAELISEDILNGVEVYTFEADITIPDDKDSSGNKSFLNFYFNDTASLADLQKEGHYSVANSQFACISLRGVSSKEGESFNGSTENSTSDLAFHVYNYQIGNDKKVTYSMLSQDSGSYSTNIGKDSGLVRGTTYHVAFVIDNRGETATISIFVNGNHLGTVSGFHKSVTSGFYVWTQRGGDDGLSIDNMRVTAGAYKAH